MREEKAFTWNVLFTVNNEPMNYATDIIYAVKRNYWVANTFITHELSSLFEGVECSHCNKNKLACLPLSTQHVEVKGNILRNAQFQKAICDQVDDIDVSDFPLELKINNNQQEWNEIVYENTTHKILKKQ